MRPTLPPAVAALWVVSALASPLVTHSTRAKDVDFQPLAAQATRVADAMEQLGSPLSPDDRKALDAAVKQADAAKGVADVQQVLDRYCLLLVSINPEGRVKAARGAAEPELVEGG